MCTPWKIVSKETVLKTSIFDINIERATCPRNGKTGSFYVFDIPAWVNVVALTPENQIVMIRQFRHGTKQFEYEIPGGLIDKEDADPVAAGMRELLEETGYSGENARIIGKVSPNPAIQNNVCYTVLTENAKMLSPTAMEDAEDIETIIMSPAKVRQMAIDGEIMHGLVLNALSFFFQHSNEGGHHEKLI